MYFLYRYIFKLRSFYIRMMFHLRPMRCSHFRHLPPSITQTMFMINYCKLKFVRGKCSKFNDQKLGCCSTYRRWSVFYANFFPRKALESFTLRYLFFTGKCSFAHILRTGKRFFTYYHWKASFMQTVFLP